MQLFDEEHSDNIGSHPLSTINNISQLYLAI